MTVAWNAPGSNGGAAITGYTVTSSPDGKTCTWTSGPLSCTVTGLTNGTAYQFAVTAANSVGTGPGGTTSSSVTPAATPGAPTIASVDPGDAQVTVAWNAPGSNGGAAITGYTVTASPGGKTCTTTGALTCAVSGLTNGTAYQFTVTATNAAGTGSASVASSSVTPAAPSPPICNPGSYLKNGACAAADLGYFVPNTGATTETPCPTGTFSSVTGSGACAPAPPGSFVSASAASSAAPCPAGTYAATSGSVSCTSAPAGSYATGPAATSASPCAAGTYSSNPGAAACTPAPAGTYVSRAGATSATPCAAGTYSSAPGAASCTHVSAGFYVSTTGATSEIACAAGATTNASGTGCVVSGCRSTQSATTPCPPGSTNPCFCAHLMAQVKEIRKSALQIDASYDSIVSSAKSILKKVKSQSTINQVNALLKKGAALDDKEDALLKVAEGQKDVYKQRADVAEGRKDIAIARIDAAQAREIAAIAVVTGG